MRIINIASALTLLLCSFKGTSSAIIKGAESTPEINQDSRIGETPEVTNVRAKSPETVTLSDVASPQLPTELKATLSHASTKRCVIPGETVGSTLGEAPLSLTRRDLTDIRKQQCENCKNRKLCKERKMCSHCKAFCDVLPTVEEETGNDVPALPPQEKRELPGVDNNVVLGARLQETDENVPRYYSLGSVGKGPLMRFLSKIFKAPETYEKYILLGMKNGKGLGQNMNDVLIIDLVQAFGDQKNTPASVYQFESEKASSLAELFNEKFDEALFKKFRETMGEKLSKEETDKIIAEVMDEITGKTAPGTEEVASPTEPIVETVPPNEVATPKEAPFETAPRSGNVATPHEPTTQTPETETRCSDADEAIEDLLDNMPGYSGYQPYQTEDLKHKMKKMKKKKPHKEEEEEVVYNPVVIQDGYGYAEGKERSSGDKAGDKVVGEPEAINVIPEPESAPPAENQINEEPITIPRSSIQELEKNVIKVVEDSLKTAEVPELGESLREVPEIIESSIAPLEEEPKRVEPTPHLQRPGTSLEQVPPQNLQPDNTFQLKSPQPSTTVPHLEPSNNNDQNLLPTMSDGPNIAATNNLESRAEFGESSEEKSSYFGALVPAKDLPMGLTDPRVKKLYYVGENINLPLKMVQDENGVMKLRVDTDALCNCENKNCTKRHIDERFRSAVGETEEEETLPELQVSFGRDSHKREDLMDSFVDSLHDHGESSDVFKRSAKIDEASIDELIKEENEKDKYLESEKLMLENEIEKLNENIEKYNQKTRKLLNKGTVALLKDVQKTKEVDQMVTLANNLLLWMKDLSLKRLQS